MGGATRLFAPRASCAARPLGLPPRPGLRRIAEGGALPVLRASQARLQAGGGRLPADVALLLGQRLLQDAPDVLEPLGAGCGSSLSEDLVPAEGQVLQQL